MTRGPSRLISPLRGFWTHFAPHQWLTPLAKLCRRSAATTLAGARRAPGYRHGQRLNFGGTGSFLHRRIIRQDHVLAFHFGDDLSISFGSVANFFPFRIVDESIPRLVRSLAAGM